MAVKILSVDDEMDLELLLTQYFRRKIRKGEYEFSFAHNGLEALTMLLKNPDYDIILSDINMPEMDGLTLLTKINEMRNPAMKCIMVSAYGDMGNIRTAMNNGAFDFATKPIDLDDLSVTIEKAVEQINYIKNSQQEHSQLQMLKGDLAIAGEIQQAILPRIFPPFPEDLDRFDIAALMTPAADVGGDFYDFFRIDEDNVAFTIADVSGKGIPAALFMAVSRTLLRSTGIRAPKVKECIEYTNRLLCGESVDCMFVTALYCVYNIPTGKITYCNAGHNPPFILHKDGSAEMLPVDTNVVLGIVEGATFTEQTVTLQEGESILLYTDGVNEAFNPHGEEYGDDRLQKFLCGKADKEPRALIEDLLSDVKAFADTHPQSDDITILSVKRKK